MISNAEFDFLFQWHLTERCNLQCRHCYQSPKQLKELSRQECKDVIDEIAAMVADWEELYDLKYRPGFNISGGEPLLSEHLFPVVEEISARGYDWYLLTNGTLINGEVAERLRALRVGAVQVSLEGPVSIHDDIRGKGSYRAAVEGIRHLLSAQIPVTVNMTLSRLNAPHIEQMIVEMKELRVPRLGFSRVVPMGRGRNLQLEMLAPQEVKILYETLMGKKEAGLELVTGDPLAMQLRQSPVATDTPCGGCAAGVSGITMLADGTLVPCRRLDIPIGNIRSDSLREIWATSDVFTRLRTKSLYGERCGSCSRWAVCRGCRALAFSSGGREGYLADDPSCFLC